MRRLAFPPMLSGTAAAIASTALLLACGSKSSANKNDAGAMSSADGAVLTADIAKLDGAQLFAKLCATCHADDATGYRSDNAPSLVNKTFLESATDDQIRRSISQGRPGTAMAGYGQEVGGPLDGVAVARLTHWIRGHGSLPLPLAPTTAGDANAGAELYTAHCTRCHGTKDARGTAVHLMNPKFLEVSSDPFLKYAISLGRPGTPMEPWGGKLTELQVDNVVAYLRTFDKSPHVTLLAPPTGKEPIVVNPQGKAPVFKLRADPCGPDPKCKPDERYVSVDQVKEAFEQKRKMVLIDARPPSDWMRVHIPGAISVPYHDMKRLAEIPNDGTWIIAYCACPHHLSGDIVNELRKRGYKHAVVLDEGILEWHRRGYPVTAAPGVEPPPSPPGYAPGGGAADAGTSTGTPLKALK